MSYGLLLSSNNQKKMGATSTDGSEASSCISKDATVRRRTDLTSLWGDQFMNYDLDSQVAENYSKQIDELKDEVRRMLSGDHHHQENRMLQKESMMDLINALERLGISYHFEDEIEFLVQKFFNENTNYGDESYDLYTTAVHFRIFRQHGHRISSDIFRKFKDESSGNFLKSLESDVTGLISLYEAAHLRVHKETILEDALSFATANLKSMAISPELSLTTRKQISTTLAQPLHFGIPRIQARNFISIYEDIESKSETLLKFAKLDYNFLQMLHKQEMSELTRWWKELDMVSQLPYARDRMVECYYWAQGTYYEPQYSLGRIMLTKAYTFTSLLNDTYDASRIPVDDLEIFTDAIQRWDINEIDHLPTLVKPLYKALLELYAEFENEVANEGRTYAVDYAKEAVKEIARSYHIEAKGFIQGPIPSFAEYIANGIITCTHIIHTVVSLVLVQSATPDKFEWLKMRHKIVVACGILGRLSNDLSSYERETEEEGHFANGIDCYMKEHCVGKEEAVSRFIEMIENAWMDTNEECLKQQQPSNYPRDVVARIVNYNRLVHVSYKNYQDGYTDATKNEVKQQIIASLVDSIQIA